MKRQLQLGGKIALWLGIAFTATSILLVLALRWVDPPSSMVISAWERNSGRQAQHQWRPLEQISPHLQMAVIAAEDQKFRDHFGFDFTSMMKALNEDRGRIRGASTISQQTAKNLFLWNGRSYVRKALEAWFTLLMEILWSKERILEVYLNVAEFGEGVYGAQAAARNFYGTSAPYITRWQAGRLAAVLPSPRRMSARYPSAYVRNRTATIVRQMRQLGGTGYLRQL
ncbi:monofunctional biosynthetic peptidoglycan transglycosylase [Microbulbifer yueqingensis]|uniref:Biosynthetic peptidoglycan transglycosylase n=1 Tax=Microbulbifer yueqingensis TaxID=658219 RepID=A0A1G9EI12_9GAMM|nr:monofunctional biosynthetic peptidoglycan transglycosylase [Microbulbifer yueqingensis]SDK75675.1 monofunctional biosynthetic peptidoglycan transglycosylase [Microbulbifer yueqingensis]